MVKSRSNSNTAIITDCKQEISKVLATNERIIKLLNDYRERVTNGR